MLNRRKLLVTGAAASTVALIPLVSHAAALAQPLDPRIVKSAEEAGWVIRIADAWLFDLHGKARLFGLDPMSVSSEETLHDLLTVHGLSSPQDRDPVDRRMSFVRVAKARLDSHWNGLPSQIAWLDTPWRAPISRTPREAMMLEGDTDLVNRLNWLQSMFMCDVY